MITILLVEDAYDLAQVLERELVANGYQVTWAGIGEEALRLHASVRPALVILDWMLPGMDGLDYRIFCRMPCVTRHLAGLLLFLSNLSKGCLLFKCVIQVKVSRLRNFHASGSVFIRESNSHQRVGWAWA